MEAKSVGKVGSRGWRLELYNDNRLELGAYGGGILLHFTACRKSGNRLPKHEYVRLLCNQGLITSKSAADALALLWTLLYFCGRPWSYAWMLLWPKLSRRKNMDEGKMASALLVLCFGITLFSASMTGTIATGVAAYSGKPGGSSAWKLVGDLSSDPGDLRVPSVGPPLATGDLKALLALRLAWNIPPSFWNESQNPCGASGTAPWPGVLCSMVENERRVVSLSNPYLAFGEGRLLTGVLPPEIGNLTALTGIRLDGTRLTGRLPESLGRLQSLQNVSIAGAGLTGPLPAEIQDCRSLAELDLSENQLSGPISPRFAPPGLMMLDLGGNYLTGVVPEELAAVLALKVRGCF
jgi:hypothetical protein